MKTIFSFLLLTASLWSGTGLQPYLLIGESGKTVENTASMLIQSFFFSDYEIEVLGEYHPYGDSDRMVLVVTNSTLEKAIAKCSPSGGYLGGIRVGITAKGEDMTYISIQNPGYWANAWFQDDYDKVAEEIEKFTQELKYSMPRLRMRIDLGFGSGQDYTAEDIRRYHYKKRKSPRLENAVLLGEFDSHNQAVAVIEKNLEKSSVLQSVFKNDIDGTSLTLFGVGLAKDTESKISEMLDTGDRKHTAFFPYELLVDGPRVYMLPGRYRIPLSFPDMTKSQYSKIKSLAENIEKEMSTLMVK